MATDQGIRIQGSVKWFSNKKCFGFITPDEGASSTGEDVFVHQSSIHSEGFRTLREDWIVEFTVGLDDNGRPKAENVTAVGGGPCTGPHKSRARENRGNGEEIVENHDDVNYEEGGGNAETGGNVGAEGGNNRRRRRRGKGEGGGNEDGGGEVRNGRGRNSGGRNRRSGEPKQAQQPFWHEILDESVKSALEMKSISTASGTIDVSIGKDRIKFGTGGYASMANADALVAEGTFLCTSDGIVSLSWIKCIALSNGVWAGEDATLKGLTTSVSLISDDVHKVGPDETDRTLWGDVPEPRAALEESGFLMRRIVLTPKKRNS
mmetsp:Transcript_39279/g.45837  ORF Transcript_39279/g.45837 Transcript_39279/m.45837 type:complete len:320 (-) Transcript_39279:365-1324(-)|eukprot:CAMPEP_0194352712 /NCGR_PEP_ID=MMETSP0174-20130528/1152_1 /TAXON_ID=216777 /ORGANISM="Proboscia alata, Strain PI-D3" /LENGTH=319 /DNA_ID=CAMNT_0039120955 /DNA_START=167 /DNA_END=1126 /DNA_ORIENTATION=+